MSSLDGSADGRRDIEILGKGLGFPSRRNLEATSASQNVIGKENVVQSEDQEVLYSRVRAQEKEIMYLKEQIAVASTRHLQMLNEKYALERKFSELRMAVDEKQNEVITSASNELARRKGDLEVNLNLLNELKVVEDERRVLTVATIGILAENGALSHVTNASSLTNSIKNVKMQAIKEKLNDMSTMRKAKAEAREEEKAEKEFAKARVQVAHEVRLAREAEAAMDLHVNKAAEKAAEHEHKISHHTSNEGAVHGGYNPNRGASQTLSTDTVYDGTEAGNDL